MTSLKADDEDTRRKLSLPDGEETRGAAIFHCERHEARFGIKNYLNHFYEDCAGVGFCHKEDIDFDKIEKRKKWD